MLLLADARINRREALGTVAGAMLAGCHSRPGPAAPSIEFTRVPQADPGGQEKNDIIEGTVKGHRPGQTVAIYARSGNWWVQPMRTSPLTKIQPNGKWTNATHLGTEYAALLVDPGFRPPFTYDALPARGGSVAAVAAVNGQAKPPSVTIPFSGYEWRLRDAPSDRGGYNLYSPANVEVDSAGALHLRARKAGEHWSCSEMSLTRSLGYGTYRFAVRDIGHLDPGVVFGMFTWDYAAADASHREMDIEISRWGDPANSNAQFVVQPYYVAANVLRFSAPAGPITFSFHWEPGRVTFRSVRGAGSGERAAVVAEHVFTSGVPDPGIESVRMNHYAFQGGRSVRGESSEVVVERFEYLP